MASTSPRSVGATKIRDTNNIPKLLSDIDKIITRVANKVGDYLAGKIVDKMVAQDKNWKPLAASTIAAKGSSKAWIDSGELMGLIEDTAQSIRVDGTNPKMVQVGIFEHEKAFIAYCLEFGTNGGSIVAGGMIHTWNHIPERPLFRAVFDEEREKVIDLIHTELGKELDNYLLKFSA